MKICITSYYGIREALEGAAKALQQLGHTVVDYPLYQKNVDRETRVDDIVKDFAQYLQEEQPDGILWWCIAVDTGLFAEIKRLNPDVKYWYFNWDEPFNWQDNDLRSKARHFDAVFVCCLETTGRYLENGCRRAVYCLPGYDPETFYPQRNPEYKYDVSMILTNLYTDPNKFPDQVVNRYHLIKSLYQAHLEGKFNLALFGPESVGHEFPEAYRGFCRYRDLNETFNSSKINITTHVIGNREGYLNERTVTLIGSAALFVIDPVKGLELNLKPGENCLTLHSEDPVSQMCDILDKYDSYRQIKKNIENIRSNYSWEIWAKTLDYYI